MTIIIEGELCDLNTYIQAERGHRTKAAKIKKEETERCMLYALSFKHRPLPKGPVRLKIDWYTADLRKDVDNVAFAKKFILDGFVAAGVLPDDSRKYVIGFSGENFYTDKARPRVEVTLEPEVP